MLCSSAGCIRVIQLTISLAVLSGLAAVPPAAGSLPFQSEFPEEPERYDSEYYLDMLTMRFDRGWRDLWYNSDNVFRMRFGSLNVEQWGLEEELKFSADLTSDLRIRYWMNNRYRLDPRSGEGSELELEYGLFRRYYVSLIIGPAFWKRENDIGIRFQRRTERDRFAAVTFRVLDFANNFACRHGENMEDEDNIYTTQPVMLELEAREEMGKKLRFGLKGYTTNRWEKEYRFLLDQTADYCYSAIESDISVWLERDILSCLSLAVDASAGRYIKEKEGEESYLKKHRVVEFFPRIWWYPGRNHGRPEFDGEEGLSGGEDKPDRVAAPSLAVCAGLQWREERWCCSGCRSSSFEKSEVLPLVRVIKRLGGKNYLEMGFLADNYHSLREGKQESESRRWENRIELAWEIRFNSGSRLRLIETIDLDREDWGQFSLHDHFFIMVGLIF